jgi:hypothetical protein
LLGLLNVADDRDAAGNPFPSVQINDGPNRNIFFGVEGFFNCQLIRIREF